MKLFTTESQTAKLIELGFEKPKTPWYYDNGTPICGGYIYSIGELIEMLDGQCIEMYQVTDYWRVSHEICDKCADELIDALYNMAVKLKEEGVI